MLNCKHGNNKMKCEECFADKFGKACTKCGKRKQIFAATGSAEGGRDSICKCDEK